MRTLSMNDYHSVFGGDPAIGPITQTAAGMRMFTALGAVVTVGMAAYEGMSVINEATGLSDAIAEAAATAMLDPEIEVQDTNGSEE